MQPISIYIAWVGTGLAFFTLYILSVGYRKESSLTHKLLCLLVFCWAWTMLVTTSIASGIIMDFPHLFRTAIPLGFLIGPTAFLYIQNITYPEKKISAFSWLYFLPAGLAFLDLLPFYLSSAVSKQEAYLAYLSDSSFRVFSVTEGILPANGIFWIMLILGIGYVFAQGRLLYLRAKENTNAKGLKIDDRQLIWLTALIVFQLIGALTLAWTLSSVEKDINVFYTYTTTYTLGFVFLSSVLYRCPEILYGQAVVEAVLPKETKKNSYVPISDEQIEEYAQQVKAYMQTHQPYLNPELSLNTLAQELAISRNHLSIVLNNGMGVKFNDLINQHRLLHLAHQFETINYPQLTIEGIASEVGFKSRTTFMHSVKKMTGLTPSKFIESLREKKPLEISIPN